MSKTTRATQVLARSGVEFTVHTYDYDPNAERVGLQAADALGDGLGLAHGGGGGRGVEVVVGHHAE